MSWLKKIILSFLIKKNFLLFLKKIIVIINFRLLQIDSEKVIVPNKFSKNETEIIEILTCLYPHTVNDLFKIVRIGNEFDGGYCLINNFENVKNVISLGVGPEDNFGINFAKCGIMVNSYDHTVDFKPNFEINFKTQIKSNKITVEPSNFYRFHKTGIRPANKVELNCITIQEILAKIPLDDNVILKMDIDGFEYDILKDILEFNLLQKFSQIVVEFDNFPVGKNNYSLEYILSIFSTITKTHKVVFLSPNNIGDWNIISGFAIPRCLEITFCRNDVNLELKRDLGVYLDSEYYVNSPFFPAMRRHLFDFKMNQIS